MDNYGDEDQAENENADDEGQQQQDDDEQAGIDKNDDRVDGNNNDENDENAVDDDLANQHVSCSVICFVLFFVVCHFFHCWLVRMVLMTMLAIEAIIFNLNQW